MNIEVDVPTDNVESWQVSQWIDQGYIVMSFVRDYQGPVKDVWPGKITIAGQGGNDIVLSSIPTQSAHLQDPYILLGYPEEDIE